MQQKRKQHLFYKNGQLSCETGSQPVTLFATENTPLAQLSAETQLTAVNSQNSIVSSPHRDCIKSLSYSAYGYSRIESILGYTGQRYDRFTNHYLLGNGYRAYSPLLMRFLSPDTLSPFGKGGRNAYAYCEGDPTNNDDPSGHMFRKARKLFKGTSDASTPLISPEDRNYSRALAATANAPELEKFPAWFDHPNVTDEHLKKAAKLMDIKPTPDTWEPDPNYHYMMDAQTQLDIQFRHYDEALSKTIKMIQSLLTPDTPKTKSPARPSLQTRQSVVRKTD